jgi:hypothetical protein
MLSGRNCEPRGQAVKLGAITQAIRKEISKLNQVLHLLEGRAKQKVTKQTRAPRGKISAAGRKRIAAAQKKRWAKIRAGKK